MHNDTTVCTSVAAGPIPRQVNVDNVEAAVASTSWSGRTDN